MIGVTAASGKFGNLVLEGLLKVVPASEIVAIAAARKSWRSSKRGRQRQAGRLFRAHHAWSIARRRQTAL